MKWLYISEKVRMLRRSCPKAINKSWLGREGRQGKMRIMLSKAHVDYLTMLVTSENWVSWPKLNKPLRFSSSKVVHLYSSLTLVRVI